ncbi:molecular chaperone [Stenotrophomonas maltophilia]|nr:molecular chaperone [Stenotrophomonas maltophilia]
MRTEHGTNLNNRRAARRLLATLALALCSGTAFAQVAMQGTRVVLPAAKPEVAVHIRNNGDEPVLVQAWVADGDARQRPEDSKAPFVLAPPLVRLDPGKDNHLRIRKLAEAAPTDAVEHLYSLDILTVPARSKVRDESQLELVVRSRYKLLYRPEGLGEPVDPPAQLSMQIREGEPRVLAVRNGSAFHVNLGDISVVHAGGETALDNPAIPPRGERLLRLPEEVKGSVHAVKFRWIDDDGSLHPAQRDL